MIRLAAFFLIYLTAVVRFNTGWAQGCSDAGFCSFGSLKNQGTDSVSGSKLQVALPFGIGDEDVRIFTPGLQYDHQFSERWGIQTKVTWNYVSGNLASVSGPGDIYIAGIYTAPMSGTWKVTGMIASKIPLNQSSLEKDGLGLPMVYQSSLGTVDLISGMSFMNRGWIISLGWQQPLSGENDNEFLPTDWDMPEVVAYPPSNEFNRKGDALLRFTYSRQLGTAVLLQVGLLNIYHLGNDTYKDPAFSNQPISIKGSKGLTMNITGSAWVNVGRKLKAGITAGVPFLVRDIRPDGLTRHFVVSPELQWKFN